MTEDILDAPEQAPVQYKIFSPKNAFWGTFLGGPLVLGYLMAHNYKAFGENHKIAASWAIVIVCALGVMFLPELIPILQKVSFLTSLLISLGGQSAMAHLQKESTDAHLARGGKFQPWQVTLLIGIVGLVVTVLAAILVLLLVDPEKSPIYFLN